MKTNKNLAAMILQKGAPTRINTLLGPTTFLATPERDVKLPLRTLAPLLTQLQTSFWGKC